MIICFFQAHHTPAGQTQTALGSHFLSWKDHSLKAELTTGWLHFKTSLSSALAKRTEGFWFRKRRGYKYSKSLFHKKKGKIPFFLLLSFQGKSGLNPILSCPLPTHTQIPVKLTKPSRNTPYFTGCIVTRWQQDDTLPWEWAAHNKHPLSQWLNTHSLLVLSCTAAIVRAAPGALHSSCSHRPQISHIPKPILTHDVYPAHQNWVGISIKSSMNKREWGMEETDKPWASTVGIPNLDLC